MSFGPRYESFGYGYLRTVPRFVFYSSPALAVNPNVTFLASTGDAGADRYGAN